MLKLYICVICISGDIGGYMGLLLGGSILTLFELLDFFMYNSAWKAGHKVSNANRIDRNSNVEPVVVNGREPSAYRSIDNNFVKI